MSLWNWLTGSDSRFEGEVCAKEWLDHPDEIDLSPEAVNGLYQGESHDYGEFMRGFRDEVRRQEPTRSFLSRLFG